MQKIFTGFECETLNDLAEKAEAFFCNDESFVLVASKQEILQMQSENCECVDFENAFVVPTFFDINGHIYEMIESELKNAKKDKFIEKKHLEQDNYDKFDNFEAYLEVYKNIEQEYIKNGITTVFEMNINQTSFAFWKKMSDTNNLKIDIVGYVNILKAKSVMDNNCRTYRKYKNHFRLGGYLILLDGDVLEKQAWIAKNYKNEKGYLGCGVVLDEQLRVMIKAAIDEKKQLVAEASGSKAIDQFLRVAEDVFEEKKSEDKFLPILKNCLTLSKRQLDKIKELEIAVDFDVELLKNHSHKLMKILGFWRYKKLLPIKRVQKFGVEFLLHGDSKRVPNVLEFMGFAEGGKNKKGKSIAKQLKVESRLSLEKFSKTAAKYCFDESQKGSLESGKRANFVVLKKIKNSATSENSFFDYAIESVYVDANLIYSSNKK